MARIDDEDDTFDSGPNGYQMLRDEQERRHARHGGRRLLVGNSKGEHSMRVVASPSPLLAALRANQPVTVDDWQIPREGRDSPVEASG
ncbi:hypothetical protein [Mycolicibacterium holsaticum]|uniref:Uncharacterized protein n=1 Tax=Mycolicibacterium holsaticum TaxID=152142 RepID=A0A1E3R8S0_9MYCO|nr:hypothetical protein [Mycolicibacterium holsaticum]ODQ86328.1 hypothetical protein BHQ17_20895 [Mycolicibacterium holsaticum]